VVTWEGETQAEREIKVRWRRHGKKASTRDGKCKTTRGREEGRGRGRTGGKGGKGEREEGREGGGTFSKKISSEARPASVMQTMSMICSLLVRGRRKRGMEGGMKPRGEIRMSN